MPASRSSAWSCAGTRCSAQRTDRPDISTGRESQVSVQHAVAAALVQGRAGLDQFTDECARDPAVIAMRAQGRGGPRRRDPDGAAQVELWTHDGTKHALSTSAARGTPGNPMSDRDIEDKLRAIAEAWQPGHDVEPLIDAVWTLDRSDDVSKLLALTVPRG